MDTVWTPRILILGSFRMHSTAFLTSSGLDVQQIADVEALFLVILRRSDTTPTLKWWPRCGS